MKTLTLRMPDELHKELKLRCVERDVTMNDYVIELIREALFIMRSDKYDEVRKAIHGILEIPIVPTDG